MNDFSIYAVCGKPILHSKSPDIFRFLFDKENVPACYTRITSSNPKEILTIADELNLSGLNVTAPFKSDMYKLMDESDEDSMSIKAVNTINIIDGKKFGYNTDIIGVVETLKQNRVDLDNRDCLIVGYGNAASAAAYGIKKEWNNVKLYVTGRTKNKVEDFAEKFNCYTEIPQKLHLILSAIPRKTYLDINQYLRYCDYFMDAAYPNSLMSNEAKQHNCTNIPGEEWLVNQALASFKIFTGKEILRYNHNDCKDEIPHYAQNDIKQNIFLTGFSGSGKSSIGKLLSEKLGYLHFDTDKLIEERENLTINEIFKQKGEDYFRNAEKLILDKISNINKAVISCGGGTLLNDDSVLTARKNGYIIWLHTPLEKCLKRIDTKCKPMLISKSNKEIENLYNERKIMYCKSSDLLVANTGESLDAVENIVYEMNMLFNNSEF